MSAETGSRAGKIVLASRSEARAAMLAAAGVPVDLDAADIDECAAEAGAGKTDPAAIAAFLALAKARAVSHRHPGRIVLGADQTCALGTLRFGKAPDDKVLTEQLFALRGNTHHLHSAAALVRDGEVLATVAASAALTMRSVSDAFLHGYVARNGAILRGSVGGYQLEREGIQLFERIEGDYFTILGLPLLPVLEALRHLGCLER